MKRVKLKYCLLFGVPSWLAVLFLALVAFELWGGYELISHGIWRRIIKVESLQKLKVKSVPVQDVFKKRISHETWFNSNQPLQQYLGALNWTMNQVRKIGYNSSGDPVDLLNSVESGQGALCGDMVDLYQNVLAAIGRPSRKVWLLRNLFDTYDTHGTTEVLVNGRWVIMDPTFGVSFTDSPGELLGAQEVKAHLLNGNYRDVQPIFYKKAVYPARIQNNYLNFILYFNNVFVIEDDANLFKSLPPLCFWIGPRMYYEDLPYASDTHIRIAQHMYFVFAFLLPTLILTLIFSWLLSGFVMLKLGKLKSNSSQVDHAEI